MPSDKTVAGMVIALCGPDGTGKSTLAEVLEDHLQGPVHQIHHKPEFLPYPQPDEARDFTRPYELAKRSRFESLLKISYLYLDWLLAWIFRIRPWSRRGGHVIIQRPWLDMLVDPDRYRLDVPEWLVIGLGRCLPSPDLVLLLQAPAEIIASRKEELSVAQITAQGQAWQRLLQKKTHVEIDVSGDLGETCEEVLTAVAGTRRSLDLDLFSMSGTWFIPRRPRRAAVTGTRIFHPINRRGRFLSVGAGIAARMGIMRLAPRAQLPDALAVVVSQWLRPEHTLAARRLREGARWLVLLIDHSGRPTKAVKIGLTTENRAAIEAEKRALEAVRPLLAGPLAVPTLHESPLGSLATDAVEWLPRRHALTLPAEVANGLGALFARSGHGSDPLRGIVHGDLAPWNILWDGRRWYLIDWEESRPDGEPFHDIFHFYVQGHTLLSNPSAKAIVSGLTSGSGPVGESIAAFAAGAGIPPRLAARHFDSYLARSVPHRDDSDDSLRTALERRDDLWTRWRDHGWKQA